ncbi:hypothetical protein, partial [Escherichia coli]|uniref:hypothetical protein n=1 Tax=Escherichia coli TaxID=562 RepID=UPI001BC84A5A
KRVFLVILFTSFSGSLVSRISGAVHLTPHTSHLTPHNSGSGQKAALDVDYRMVWAFSGMVTGK